MIRSSLFQKYLGEREGLAPRSDVANGSTPK